ncbi:MAG: hypothetical protein F4X64_11375 [Chloroflexi bacterium]|nr:hypothetical protein [Chloroflexota bacterium]
MGLSIGVVTIDYLPQPPQPMYKFMQDLMADPGVGTDMDLFDDAEPWEAGDGENVFYEFERDELLRRADGWAAKQHIDAADRATLLQWVDHLPYRGDFIMLHLGI